MYIPAYGLSFDDRIVIWYVGGYAEREWRKSKCELIVQCTVGSALSSAYGTMSQTGANL